MVQSPSSAANWFAATQEIPRISQNPKAHYRTHKRSPPASILGQPIPVHTPTSHLLEIHSNIIHPSKPRSPQWSPSLRFPQQDPTHTPLLIHDASIQSEINLESSMKPHLMCSIYLILSHPDFSEQDASFEFWIRNGHKIVIHFYQQGVLVENMDFY